MIENPRSFEAGRDPQGNVWKGELVWLQTATSIRHADSVDVKFKLSSGGRVLEKVVALPHPALLTLAAEHNRVLTDPWCMRLAAAHIVQAVKTGEDMEKGLITVTPEQLRRYAKD